MTADDDEIIFNRILVALDSSSHSMAALKAAVSIAKFSEAEIKSLFVRDRRWTEIGRLPFTREISEITGEVRSIEEKDMEQEIKLLENRIRHALDEVVRQSPISSSFQTVEGPVEKQIIEAAEEADLITIGHKSHSFSRHNKLGRTARFIIRKSDKPILLLQRGLSLGDDIAVLYDGSTQGQNALRLAHIMAQKKESKLTVVAMKSAYGGSEKREKALEEQLNHSSVELEIHLLKHKHAGNLCHIVNQQKSGLLIAPKQLPFFKGRRLETMLASMSCPLLLMT